MKKSMIILPVIIVYFVLNTSGFAESGYFMHNTESATYFPDLSEEVLAVQSPGSPEDGDIQFREALWPFGGKDDDVAAEKPKSSRKAFFLSLLVPGLGEAYVGSKRSLVFLGIEAASWWIYFTNNREGNDIESDYEQWAGKYWHYNDTTSSSGAELNYNYWGWLQRKYEIPVEINPTDYAAINDWLEKKTESGGFESVHNLPSTKTQQYYEMIGKYDQFVFGWEDVDNADLNPQLVDNLLWYENTVGVLSPLRIKYMKMRGDSNDKLDAAQRGIHIMLINRVLSAIDAGRLAYKHNKKLDSDLSMIRVRIVQKRILDNNVPMLMVSKEF